MAPWAPVACLVALGVVPSSGLRQSRREDPEVEPAPDPDCGHLPAFPKYPDNNTESFAPCNHEDGMCFHRRNWWLANTKCDQESFLPDAFDADISWCNYGNCFDGRKYAKCVTDELSRMSEEDCTVRYDCTKCVGSIKWKLNMENPPAGASCIKDLCMPTCSMDHMHALDLCFGSFHHHLDICGTRIDPNVHNRYVDPEEPDDKEMVAWEEQELEDEACGKSHPKDMVNKTAKGIASLQALAADFAKLDGNISDMKQGVPA